MQILLFIAFLAVGVVQLIAGFTGIEHHFNEIWAFVALGAALIFRFTLPMTIACYFGATDVWGWHWIWALVLTLPGLIFVVPGFIANLFASLKTNRA